MAPKWKRQSHSGRAMKLRWATESHVSSDDINYSMEISDEDDLNSNHLNFKDNIKILVNLKIIYV